MMAKRKEPFDPSGTAAGRPVRPSGLDRPPMTLPLGLNDDEREQRKPEAQRLAARIERELMTNRLVAIARYDHVNKPGTPATYTRAKGPREGALSRLHENGDISHDELAYAVEIAMVAESIERDVDPGIVNYEPRIDCSASGRNSIIEGILRVRREVAYTHWRAWIPQPKRAVLDMIVGDPKPFSTVAREYRIGHRAAKRMLIQSLNLWPGAMDLAEKEVDDATLAAAYAAIL